MTTKPLPLRTQRGLDILIAPSLLAADFTRLGEQVLEAEAAGADMLHLDVMDGHFVPNITFGPLVVAAVRRVTGLPLDVHLMVEHPERLMALFVEAGATTIQVHVETCPNLHRTLQQIRDLGARPGVTLNPHTPFEMIREVLGDVERVLVMTVNPGAGGQRLIPATLKKLAQIRQALNGVSHPVELAVDGGVDVHSARQLVEHGANVLIAGTAIFGASEGVTAGMASLRMALDF